MKTKTRLRRAIEQDAKDMPLVMHSKPGESFDLAESELADYLCSLPSVRSAVCDTAKTSGAIVYDNEIGAWHGVDHEITRVSNA